MAKTFKKGKKPNPTWSDVTEGKQKGVDMALTFCLTVLRDKFGFDDDEAEKFMREIADLSESYLEGRVNLADLKMVQLKEYSTDLR